MTIFLEIIIIGGIVCVATLAPLGIGLVIATLRQRRQLNAKEIPARERWLWDNKEAMAMVQRGLEQSAAGKTLHLPLGTDDDVDQKIFETNSDIDRQVSEAITTCRPKSPEEATLFLTEFIKKNGKQMRIDHVWQMEPSVYYAANRSKLKKVYINTKFFSDH